MTAKCEGQCWVGWLYSNRKGHEVPGELCVDCDSQLELISYQKDRSLSIVLKTKTGSSLPACDSEDEFEW